MGKAPSTKSAARLQKAGTAKTSQTARKVKQASMKARSHASSSKARDNKQREQLDDMLSQLQQGGEERPNPLKDARKSVSRTNVSQALDGLEQLHT